jgi:hypothetical protein
VGVQGRAASPSAAGGSGAAPPRCSQRRAPQSPAPTPAPMSPSRTLQPAPSSPSTARHGSARSWSQPWSHFFTPCGTVHSPLLLCNCRTVSTDRPSDLLVEVDEVSFHLHKVCALKSSESPVCVSCANGVVC